MKKKKIISIEDRIPNLKKERKKKANRRLIFYLSIFFLLILIIVYLQSPLSNVKQIMVTGNTLLSKEEVIEESQLTNKTNIWSINKSKINKKMMKHPVIKSVDIEKTLFGKVNINVVEHDLVAYREEDKRFSPILGNGTVLDEVSFVGNAPFLIDFNEEDLFESMIQELQDLPRNILNLISEIHWQPKEGNKYKILLYMNDGFIVDGSIRNFAEKMQIYPSIVSQIDSNKKGIIHIGVGAYFEEFENEDEGNK